MNKRLNKAEKRRQRNYRKKIAKYPIECLKEEAERVFGSLDNMFNVLGNTFIEIGLNIRKFLRVNK